MEHAVGAGEHEWDEGKQYPWKVEDRMAMIPAMMTWTTHFIRSGRKTDMAEMLMPDFAVL